MTTPGRLPAWRTSSHSGDGQTCVEVAPGPRAVLVRDTKDRGLGPILLLDDSTWTEFRAAALTRRTGAAGDLTITCGEEGTCHAGADVATTWHVTVAGRTLHFTDAEWVAFAAGARDGEFDFAIA